MIFLAKGDCLLGVNGKPPSFRFCDDGNCVAVGEISGEALQALEAAFSPAEHKIEVDVFGDFDSAGYLEQTMKLLNPKRRGNVPNFKEMFQLAVRSRPPYAECPLLEYCNFESCSDCICQEWTDELEETQESDLARDAEEVENS